MSEYNIYQDVIDQFHASVKLDQNNNVVSFDQTKAHQNLCVLMLLFDEENGASGSPEAIAHAQSLIGDVYKPVVDELAKLFKRPEPTYKPDVKPSSTVVYGSAPTNSL